MGGALLAAGCDSKPDKAAVSARSSVEVALPPRPDMTRREPVTHHADGSWTVEGLLRDAGEQIGRTAKVKGKVVFVHKCPADAPGGECSPPAHLYLADSADTPDRWQLLVTGTGSRVLQMAQEGLTLTMEGRLEMVSGDRNFIRQSGLLVLPSDAASSD